MVAIKPKRYSEVHKNDLAIITDALGEASGSRLFYCGQCNDLIRTERTKAKPKFCSKCGVEIDWVDFFVKIMKVCPTCNQTFDEKDMFCTIDGSKLQDVPIEKS